MLIRVFRRLRSTMPRGRRWARSPISTRMGVDVKAVTLINSAGYDRTIARVNPTWPPPRVGLFYVMTGRLLPQAVPAKRAPVRPRDSAASTRTAAEHTHSTGAQTG